MWCFIKRDRIALKARFIRSFVSVPNKPTRVYGVEVTNYSRFPVTIIEVGLNVHGTIESVAFAPHITLDDLPLPRRLESREKVTVYIPAEQLQLNVAYKDVYATTACGVTIRNRQKDFPRAVTH